MHRERRFERVYQNGRSLPQSTGGLPSRIIEQSTESTAVYQSTSPPRSPPSTGVYRVHRVDGGLATPQLALTSRAARKHRTCHKRRHRANALRVSFHKKFAREVFFAQSHK